MTRLTERMLLMTASNASDPWQSICSASVDKRFTNANTLDVGTWRRRLPINASRHCSAIGKSLAESPANTGTYGSVGWLVGV